MRVFYRGFNLHNQFPHCNEYIVEVFIDRYFQNSDRIELAHSFSVVTSGNVLHYFGGNHDGYNHNEEIKIDSHQKIIKVHCSDDRILILNNDGIMLKISIDCLNHVGEVSKFWSSEEVVKKLSVGSKMNIAYTGKGSVYNIPEKLSYTNPDVINIKSGREHCLMLDRSGNVYSFGRGSRGQLGHGTLEDEDEPKLVEALAGLKMIAIAAGGWHSGAISDAGDLYIWGWNGNGQLGFGADGVSVMATPKLIDLENEINVVKVACGNRHTIILLDDGRLYGCGWNKYKQLINNELENISVMTYLHDFSNHHVIRLKCGSWSSAVVCK